MENQEQAMPERMSLPTEVLNEILNVFGSMPYNQSAGIIQKIQSNIQAVEPVGTVEIAEPLKAKLSVKK